MDYDLLKSAQVFETIKHSQEYGININGEIEADFNKIIDRSRKIAEGMSKGVQFLMKKNKIDIIKGLGKILKQGIVEVKDEEGKSASYSAKHIIIATGARSKELPDLKQDGEKIIGYRQALVLAEKPKTMLVVGSGAIGTELASVGLTEKAAIEAGHQIKVGKFPFSASGKASASGAKEGFVKLIFDEKHGELLGAHMIGTNVTEMIAEIVVARKLEITGHELIKSVHPHPTMSEAIMEAAAAAFDEVIHL